MSLPYIVDGETDADSTVVNTWIDAMNNATTAVANIGAITNIGVGIFNAIDYEAVGDGVADDTDALAAAFTAADQNGPVYLPPGTYLTDTINYRGQSIIGAGSNLTIIKGKPGQDIIRHDPSLAASARERATISGVQFVVDDSIDASVNFPDRNGVGNAAWAVDFPDGAGTPPFQGALAFWQDVRFSGLSGTVGGLNKSCGIYEQTHMSVASSYEHLWFYRLGYGWYQDCPRTNLMSCEIARDMVRVDGIYFNGCGEDWRIHNAFAWNVNNEFHLATAGPAITFASDQTVSRGANWWLNFTNVYMEDSDEAFGWDGAIINSTFIGCALGPDVMAVWDGQNCRFIHCGLSLHTGTDQPVLQITGDRNHFELATSGGILDATLIDDQGDGNIVWITRFSADSGAAIYPVAINRSAYTTSNVSTDRAFDANSTTLDEVADVLGTLIADLKEMGVIR